jgi:hypothetical protein
MTCCNHTCNQGRDCPYRRRLARELVAALAAKIVTRVKETDR